MFFLASIPRSGSTLLASLLGQRDDTYVSPTSNLSDTLEAIVTTYEANPATLAGACDKDELYRTLKGAVMGKYADRKEAVIFDKGRMWPALEIMGTMKNVLGEPIKIIATVRPIVECITSFFLISGEKDFRRWVKNSQLMEHLMHSYQVLRDGYRAHPENFCIIEYDDLCHHTQRELDRISDFIGVERKKFSPVIEQVDENDNAWNIKDLHKLEPAIKKTELNPKEVMGDEFYTTYQGGEFWNDKPEPKRENEPLDLALEAGFRGEFDKAYAILKEEQRKDPLSNRVKFNLGWYEMIKGNHLRGHKLLSNGRSEKVFGNPHIGSPKSIWNGETGATVLMEMEGGLGDQLHCIRYAKNIADYGNNVVISGSMVLAEIIKDVDGVSAFVGHKAALDTYHDYWVPAMSVAIPLELEYSDLSGKAYIPRVGESEGKIGVKWSGNPEFEHQQHRLFPAEMMFDAVKGFDCISLQKFDKPTEKDTPAPDWMEQPSLENWNETRKQICRCDLVITSCTAVAHLSAAMGVETWIVIPILSYYLWAQPGNKTLHYDSVTLFRQEKYGCWKKPFWELKKKIRQLKWTDGETTRQFIEA